MQLLLLLLLLLLFSLWASLGRNQSPVRRPVRLWYTASWASSQGQFAIAFPRVQTFPLLPPDASTSNMQYILQITHNCKISNQWQFLELAKQHKTNNIKRSKFINILNFVVYSDQTVLVETSVVIMLISTQNYAICHLMHIISHVMEPTA